MKKKWSEPAYRSRPTPTGECEEAGLDGRGDPSPHCAHPTGRFTDIPMARPDGLDGVAEIVCCICGERVDAPYSQKRHAPSGHGKHHPARVVFTDYRLPAGWRHKP